jgi:hypothetical protein
MDVVPFFRENGKKAGVDAIPDQSVSPLHQICTSFPRIFLISVITVARSHVMLGLGGLDDAPWTGGELAGKTASISAAATD